MANLRRCIGSTKFGIEAHEAPPEDFPAQPSQKDGLGRMCKTHWKQYVTALRKAALARKAADADPAACRPGDFPPYPPRGQAATPDTKSRPPARWAALGRLWRRAATEGPLRTAARQLPRPLAALIAPTIAIVGWNPFTPEVIAHLRGRLGASEADGGRSLRTTVQPA